MPSIDAQLAVQLQKSLDLQRAVETGTWRGDGALRLSTAFSEVVTIELSPHFYAQASERLRPYAQIQVLLGHSVERLPEVVSRAVPTLWFLDGHWSAADTAGEDEECPVLEELALLASGLADDVLVIDDARLFAAAPPPPHDPAKWPTLMEVFDAVRAAKPDHHVTLLNDQVIAVPRRAKQVLDAYGQSLLPTPSRREQVVSLARAAVGRLRRTGASGGRSRLTPSPTTSGSACCSGVGGAAPSAAARRPAPHSQATRPTN